MLSYYSGHSIEYLTGAVAAGRESYYTGAVAAGEPPGRWYGRGAAALGLTGEVDNEVIADLYGRFIDPRDGETVLGHAGRRYATAEELFARKLGADPRASPEQREQLRLLAEKEARSNVAFHDATFNVQKSVTVLHTAFEAQEVAARRTGDADAEQAWRAHRVAVEKAIWAGNNASLDYLAQHAGYTRVGHHGGTAGRWEEAHDWTVASFFQHDSRNHDPHLHIHNAILNRVQGVDGKWRTLDWEAAKLQKAAAGAVGERVMFERLVATLGLQVAMRPDGKSREIMGVDERVMDLFSTRTHAITPKTAALVEAFEARFGHAPNALQLYRMSRVATLATRRAKEHSGETKEQRSARWDRMVAAMDEGLRSELSGGLAGVAWGALRLADRAQQAQAFDPVAVLETAVAEVAEVRAHWHESDLVKAISNALPDYLGALSGAEVQKLLRGLAAAGIAQQCEKLTTEAPGAATLPEGERLANGRSAQQRPGSELFATTDHVRSERVLAAAAVERGAVAVDPALAECFTCELAEWGTELSVGQARAVRGVLTSGARVESLVGPAGTGKTLVVGALAKAWTDPSLWGGVPRRCFGLASAQIATDVLTGEGLTARNVRAWLGAQQRLVQGRGTPEDQALALREGDLVVVDESSMANTPALATIREHADKAGAKLLLTGDHRQLAAVGAGGAMSMVAATGITYELTEVRRFSQQWERDASLRLREGDEGALQEYRKHGRIIDGGTFQEAVDRAVQGYLADTLRGLDTRLLVDTNEQAAALSAQVRAELVALGRVTETGVSVGVHGTTAGVGDLVEARRLAWELAGRHGNRRGPVTREQYRVLNVRDDGGLDVAQIIGRSAQGGERLGDQLTLPPSYVANDLELGYASTVHSVQGITVDTCHSVATSNTGRAGQYVGASRGRDRNTLYVQTIADTNDSRPGRTIARRDPLAVLDRSHLDEADDRAAIVEAAESVRVMGSVQTAAERLAEISERQAGGRTAAMLDQLVDRDVLSEEHRSALATDDNTATLARVLRQAEVAGHDPLDVLTAAITERELGDARSIASVLHHRITDRVDLEPVGDSHTDWVPKVTDPAYQRHLDDLAAAADRRRDELGEQVAADAPQWALEALGPVPDDDERAQWMQRAGTVAAHRELTGHADQALALPGPPPRTQVEAYASWRASWRALGRPEDTCAEQEMSNGQLRVVVRAMTREQAWAPPYVARDLSGTTQAAQRQRDNAELLTARAAAEHDPAQRTRLERKASQATDQADALERQVAQLTITDTARAEYLLHTAVTQDRADRARLELASRGIDPDHPKNPVSVPEWFAAHQAEQAESEPHRTITDADIDNAVDDSDAVSDETESGFIGETDVPDIREIASIEPPIPVNTTDWERVPDIHHTTTAVASAHRALLETHQRHQWETAREADERARDMAQWHAADQARANDNVRGSEPVLT